MKLDAIFQETIYGDILSVGSCHDWFVDKVLTLENKTSGSVQLSTVSDFVLDTFTFLIKNKHKLNDFF